MDKNVNITTEYIKLDQLLKYAGAVAIGSDAKQLILDGKVSVNGQPCLIRGKKLRTGDVVTVEGAEITIH